MLKILVLWVKTCFYETSEIGGEKMAKQNFIYGIHAVLEFIKHHHEQVKMAYIQDVHSNQRLQDIIVLAKKYNISISMMTKDKLQKLAGNVNHQGVVMDVLAAESNIKHDLFELLDELTEPPFLLILDGIQDPHNLGACLRSADAASVHAVIVPKDRSANITSVVRKVSSGAAERIPFIQVTNLARTMKSLQERGIWIIGADERAEDIFCKIDMKGPIAIAMGAEGTGLRQLTKKNCDYLIRIPMMGSVSSLNVSVATGIILFDAVRQRL